MYKYKKFRKELGSYFIELSKLIFGGVVLGTVLNFNYIDKMLLLVGGGIFMILFATLGFIFKNKK